MLVRPDHRAVDEVQAPVKPPLGIGLALDFR
jgi:hypothetical protein